MRDRAGIRRRNRSSRSAARTRTKTFWQQGAFGIGGATTFRNAEAVVLVSRRAPEMNPDEDVILVAVCLWQKSVKGKGLFYLVTSDWRRVATRTPCRGRHRRAEFPEFEPGTHLALINYGTERLHAIRHSDNPNSFERVLDTRLFRPVMPVRLENHLMQRPSPHAPRARSAVRGQPAPRPDARAGRRCRSGSATATYQLPVTLLLLHAAAAARRRKADTIGQKKNFVADGHAVMFTSNGQVHHHWTPVEFRERTKLRQLSEHLLVVVETDPLPIQCGRTSSPPTVRACARARRRCGSRASSPASSTAGTS